MTPKSFAAPLLLAGIATAGCSAHVDAPEAAEESVGATAEALSVPETALRCNFPAGNGLVASIDGKLRFDRSRYNGGGLPASGSVTVKLRNTATHQTRVYGNVSPLDATVARDGSFVDVFVANGTHEVYTMDLRMNGGASEVHTKSGTVYATNCAVQLLVLPHGGDLTPDYGLRFWQNPDGTQDLSIDVTNDGNVKVTAPSLRVRVGGVAVTGTLYQYWGGTATSGTFTVNPGERGFIKVSRAATHLAECSDADVAIDIDRTAQTGQPSPFGNDSRRQATQCQVKWTAPIDAARLGKAPPSWLAGKSLADVVSSRVSGRPDGLKCSACHFAGSGKPWSPPVAQGGTATVSPWDTVGGKTWMGAGGWADQFIATSIKPQELKDAFAKWKSDGAP